MFRQDGTQRILCLKSTLYYRRAFCHLQLSDSNFKHCPTQDEWVKVGKIHKFLGLFYEITCIFSGVKYPTVSLYFPHVFKVQLSLTKEVESLDDFLSRMARKMYSKFVKYWSQFSLILAIAVIFNPHYKIQFVEYCYKTLYGDGSNECFLVCEKLFSLFDEYVPKASKGISEDGASINIDGMDAENNDFFKVK